MMKRVPERRRRSVPARAAALAAASAVLAVLAGPASAATQNITTVAGIGIFGFSGEGVQATTAQLNTPGDVAATPDGGFLISDQGNARIRKVTPDGLITTVAGTGTPGADGDDGLATQAQLNLPNGVAVRGDGSILIADSGNNEVRQVSPLGVITRVAGTAGVAGFSGDNGPAILATLRFPTGVAATPDGGFLIADNDNQRIRKVDAAGTITTIGGDGGIGFNGEGIPLSSARLNNPSGIDVLPDGSFLFTEVEGARVRRVSAAGIVTTIAGNGVPGFGGDGGPATSALLNNPTDVSGLADGGAIIADRLNHRIRRILPDGKIVTIAGNGTAGAIGDGGLAQNATLNNPIGTAVTGGGDFLVADTLNHKIRVIDAGDPPAAPAPAVTPTPAPAGKGTGTKHRRKRPSVLAPQATLSYSISAGALRVVSLRVIRLSPGARVQVQCVRGCSIRKAVAIRSRSADFAAFFRGRTLPARTVITVRVTRRGAIGRFFRWTITGSRFSKTECQILTSGALSRCGIG